MSPADSDELFLGNEAGAATYRGAMERATEAVLAATGNGPYAGDAPEDHAERLDVDPLPEEGLGLRRAIEEVREDVISRSVDPSDPRCIAHLQCPPLIAGLAAETMATALNQSLDSWDQSPAATVLEERLVEERFELFDLLKPTFTKLCLNRNRMLGGYGDAEGRPHAAEHGAVRNALHEVRREDG